MSLDWTPLRRALTTCRAEGLHVPVWWRDDDAVEPTKPLEKLQSLSAHISFPVHLAVIPAHATETLAGVLDTRFTRPMVHGWTHENHAPESEKSAEFGHPRHDAPDDLSRAHDRFSHLFPDVAAPVFVPPWNRMDASNLPLLSMLGYGGVSTFGARRQRFAMPGLAQINTHIDPIDWRGTRDLVAAETLIAQTVAHLMARLQDRQDATEPLGLLTHHLVHTPAIWSFVEGWLHEMRAGGAEPVSNIAESFDEQT